MSTSMGFARQEESARSLTEQQLAHLRLLLTEALAEHRSQSKQHATLAVVLASEDAGTELALAQMAASRSRTAIVEVEQALDRLRRGVYGFCEVCEQPVPFERLEAIPPTRYCVGCPRPE